VHPTRTSAPTPQTLRRKKAKRHLRKGQEHDVQKRKLVCFRVLGIPGVGAKSPGARDGVAAILEIFYGNLRLFREEVCQACDDNRIDCGPKLTKKSVELRALQKRGLNPSTSKFYFRFFKNFEIAPNQVIWIDDLTFGRRVQAILTIIVIICQVSHGHYYRPEVSNSRSATNLVTVPFI
jgi:hypothetical protein